MFLCTDYQSISSVNSNKSIKPISTMSQIYWPMLFSMRTALCHNAMIKTLILAMLWLPFSLFIYYDISSHSHRYTLTGYPLYVYYTSLIRNWAYRLVKTCQSPCHYYFSDWQCDDGRVVRLRTKRRFVLTRVQ